METYKNIQGIIGRNSMYVRYMIQESEEESSSSDSSEEPNSDNQPNVRISKTDALVLEQLTRRRYEGELASTEEEIEDSDSETSTSSFSGRFSKRLHICSISGALIG